MSKQLGPESIQWSGHQLKADPLAGVSLADALYEKPWTYCETCNGVGECADANFYCHACNGEGSVLDEEQEQSARDEAAGVAQYCLNWFRANRDTLKRNVTFSREFDALLDAAEKIGQP